MALTAITATTKAGSQKTARQRSFSAKEDTADTVVSVPPDALKSVELKIKGINDDGAFGKNTIGQEIEGKLVLYAGDNKIRTFAHELVTKVIEHVNLTIHSRYSFTFESSDNAPALSFAYEDASMVSAKDDPILITLLITGFRDNLVMS